jgi:uncharacterized protein (DUF1501 family)
MNRRHLLSLMAAGGLVPTQLWATPQGATDVRLVVLLLRGAYDGLSALVPYADAYYYEARPRIAIAPPNALGPNLGAMRLDGRWALHPMLADTAGELFKASELSFVPFSGTSFVSRSHFQAQDWMETGKRPDQRPDVGDGFLNRLAQVLGGQAISFTQTMPVVLSGLAKVANAPVIGNAGRKNAQAYLHQVQALYAGHRLESMVTEGLGLRQALSAELMKEMDYSARGALPAAGFALQAQRVARFMRERKSLSIAFMDIGGWDTHAGQGNAQGVLANRLAALGQGIQSFADELGPEWKKTALVVVSEFGRTFHENGSGGTDHGHGNVMWLAGGAMQGGHVRGEQADLKANTLHQNRDMPVLNDYRNVLAGMFSQLYGLKPSALDAIFPDATPQNLGLL